VEITLTKQLENWILERVISGEYESPSEVVRESVRRLIKERGESLSASHTIKNTKQNPLIERPSQKLSKRVLDESGNPFRFLGLKVVILDMTEKSEEVTVSEILKEYKRITGRTRVPGSVATAVNALSNGKQPDGKRFKPFPLKISNGIVIRPKS
jgi:putative addiction module CopG family antidote